MDNNDVLIFFFFYDDSARIWIRGDAVGAEEQAFIQGLVDRFEHHNHLIWVVAEEYQERYTAVRASNIAAEIRTADKHNHPIAVHKLSGLSFSEFANDPNIDQFAIQYNPNPVTPSTLHNGMITAWNNASGQYNLNMSEVAFGGIGNGEIARKNAWAVVMGGAYVMIHGMDIENTAVNDLEDMGRIRTFFEATNFNKMSPRDDLAVGGSEYVLALAGQSYIAYASALSGNIGLKDMIAGDYNFRWFDVTTGSSIFQTNVMVGAGDQSWVKPPGIGDELAVFISTDDVGGSNTLTVANAQNILVSYETPTALTLTFSDPDGPGPHLFTIVQPPTNGTLSGFAANRTYTPDTGYAGPDSIRFSVTDGIDTSSIATVSITVQVAGNAPPIAHNQNVNTAVDTPVSLSLSYSDADGPGPYNISILRQPDHGSLSGNGNDLTYTPSVDFSGTDAFTWKVSAGLLDSIVPMVSIAIGDLLFQDDFQRTDSSSVANGWHEVETTSVTKIENGALVFNATDDDFRPLISHTFAPQSQGQVVWSFDLHFERSGSEGTYAFWMQIGEAVLMSDSSPTELGVAANLIWGGPNQGLNNHQGLGSVVDGEATEIAIVSGGPETVTVVLDLDVKTYTVHVLGQQTPAIAFENDVMLDNIRFFANELNKNNFTERNIDNVLVQGSTPSDVIPPLAPGGLLVGP